MSQFRTGQRPRGANTNQKAVAWGCGCLTLGLVFLGGCGALLSLGDEDGGGSPAAESVTESGTPTEEVTTASPAPEETTAALPDLKGMGLQEAQDAAQELGFYLLDSEDLTGRDRLQILDRNWKVCGQSPKPGDHSVEKKITFKVVKLDESCSRSKPKPVEDDESGNGGDSGDGGSSTRGATDGGSDSGGGSSSSGGASSSGGTSSSGGSSNTGGGSDDSAVYYANCDAVRAAGAAPIRRGQPGYRSGLDRDGDGTACDT